jgi:uncharacterized protein YeaO (DUF488 family)
VRKAEHAARDFYDVWLPLLAPAAATLKMGRVAQSDRDWRRFERAYRAEMAAPEARAALDLLAALSHRTEFSVGCYCAEEIRCHRRVLRSLLMQRGAAVL